MTKDENKIINAVAINTLIIAFMAALAEQVLHEISHGLAALVVGARWEALNLFSSLHSWPSETSRWGELIIAGNAAIINILSGSLCVALFASQQVVDRPTLRLFLMYFGAYSLFAGFGYLLVDPLFYRPGNTLGDWKQVVSLLGGSWAARLPLMAIGGAGTFWSIGWLARSSLCFGEDLTDKRVRIRCALHLLMIPYVGVNLIFSVLSFWHPIGWQGVFIALLKYWFGYIGFFWGFFIAGYWTDVTIPLHAPTKLSARVSLPWFIGAVAGLSIAVFVLLPTLHF